MDYDDASGRLKRDTDAAGGFTKLDRIDADHAVTLTTALNRTTTYQIENQPTGTERRVNTFPDGTQSELLIGTDGSRKTTLAAKTVLDLVQGPDPRFSMQAPIAKSLNITTGGLASTLTIDRSANLPDPNNLLSLTTQTDTLTVNGRAFTSSFNAASKTVTDTSAAGRQRTTTIDPQGRVVQAQVSGLLAANLTYDTHGRLGAVSWGTGADARTTNLSYNNAGYVQSITDPLGSSSTFQYDGAGRLTGSILPDGRKISFGYDANGNLTSPHRARAFCSCVLLHAS